MSKNKHNKRSPVINNMLGCRHEGYVLDGGEMIPVSDLAALKAAFENNKPVMKLPTMVVLSPKQQDITSSPGYTKFSELLEARRLPHFLRAFFLFPNAEQLGNAHEVAESLMVDLILAKESEGWELVKGEVFFGRIGNFDSHSWLEYKGWALDGACGKVMIWPAWYYRMMSKAKRMTRQNAGQFRKQLIKSGGEFAGLENAIASRVGRDKVNVYDLETKQVTELPIEELAPGMVQARIQGRNDIVWVNLAQAKQGTTYYHPPFSPEKRKLMQKFAYILGEVYPITIQQWEDGFRRDYHADAEIFKFTCIAEAFSRLTDGRNLPLEQRKTYYVALVTGFGCERVTFPQIAPTEHIGKEEAMRAYDVLQEVYRQQGGNEKLEELMKIMPPLAA